MAGQPTTARTIAAGVIGNMLEWYDFSVYGLLAPQIGANFFRGGDSVSQVLAAFGVFAVGFAMRPIGAIGFGYLGDRLGRTTALTFSIVAMVIPTVLIGFLPGYDTLGIAAPVLLTVLRMVQGLAGGGEGALASVFLVEHAPSGRRGLVGAIGNSGIGLGMKIAAIVTAVCATSMDSASLAAWGWRVPFLLGLVLGLAGFALRRNLGESTRPPLATSRSPLADVLRHHRPLILRLAGLGAFNAIAFQLAFVYMVYWLERADGFAPARALQINTVGMLAMTPVTLIAGWLSDRIGRRTLLLVATTIGFLGAMPFLELMHHPSVGLIFLGQFGFLVALGLGFGVLPALMVETTPVSVRCTALALGQGISFSIIAGLMPLCATWLMHRTSDVLSPAYLIMAAAALTFFAALAQGESFRTDFRTTPART
jgi:MFS transporter, MHS family, proline/betaine transporter